LINRIIFGEKYKSLSSSLCSLLHSPVTSQAQIFSSALSSQTLSVHNVLQNTYTGSKVIWIIFVSPSLSTLKSTEVDAVSIFFLCYGANRTSLSLTDFEIQIFNFGHLSSGQPVCEQKHTYTPINM
jgi:hypothetical protein